LQLPLRWACSRGFEWRTSTIEVGSRASAADESLWAISPSLTGAWLAAIDAGMSLIRVDGLRLALGGRTVLDGVSFEVDAGEVVGLLGPNGAGKTTTLSVIATLRRADAGSAVVAGHPVLSEPDAVHRVLGLVPQAIALYPTLTARENLRFFARVLGLDRREARDAIARTLAVVGLEDRADDVVATFSGGMQRRLNLAGGLLHAPRVLLLDEPTVGVDPQSRERILDAVRGQAAAGTAVVYSTHYMDEAERLCDRVVLIDHGRVIASGTPHALVADLDVGMRLAVVTRTTLPPDWLDGLAAVRALEGGAGNGRGHEAQVTLPALAAATPVLERAAALGGEVLEFHLHQPDLQDVFLRLTGRALRD
jgi:ABC-2 type transport system ATP-binding protein